MKKEITRSQLGSLIKDLDTYIEKVFQEITKICVAQLPKSKIKNGHQKYLIIEDGKISYCYETYRMKFDFSDSYKEHTVFSKRKVIKLIEQYAENPEYIKRDLEYLERIDKSFKKLKVIDDDLKYKIRIPRKHQVVVLDNTYSDLYNETVWSRLDNKDLSETGLFLTSEKAYQELLDILYEIKSGKDYTIFDKKCNLLDCYKQKSLENIDLNYINFNGTNISGIDISDNIGNLTINFDKIQKDLSNANLKGYDSKGYVLHHFDLTNANLEETNLGIDLATCTISVPSKLEKGTQFDENNTFYFGTKELSTEQVKQLGLSINKR